MRALALALIVLGGARFAAAEVIYDNTTTPLGPVSFTAQQIGDEVTARGSQRFVQELHVGLNQQGFAGTGDVQAFLYANDGPGGAPGTLLWQSDQMVGVALTGGDDLVAFDVPGVTVPDTFTWTVQVSNTTPVAVGLPHYGPPTIGSSSSNGWFGSAGQWTMLTNTSFMARVVAGCLGDVDGSGDIGFPDLVEMLAVWGDDDPALDFDGSGFVDFGDLVILLANWGPCA